MVDNRDHGVGAEDRTVDRARRNVLKIAGAGVGLAALGGASMLGAAQQESDETEDDGHFIADLVDPVYGYPLAASETNDLALDHVVDATVQEGEGAHAGFPLEPAEDGAEETEVQAEFLFDPVGLHVGPGGLVHFKDIVGLHTVTAFHEKFEEPELTLPTRVPSGVPGFTSPPLTPGESWVYQFETKGVYDYVCLPHLGLGMVGRIVVLDPDEDDVNDDRFVAPTAGELPPNVGRVLSADELHPAHIVEVGSVGWSDLTL